MGSDRTAFAKAHHVSIEPARADEAGALTTLVRASAAYHGHYRVMVANQLLDTAYLDANIVRVAHGPDGEIWGFYSLLIPGKGGQGEGELDFMFVANHLQGRGIGRALFADLRTTAGRFGLSRIHIVSHPPAEPFYLASGAHRIGQVPPAGRVTWARPHLALDLRSRRHSHRVNSGASGTVARSTVAPSRRRWATNSG